MKLNTTIKTLCAAVAIAASATASATLVSMDTASGSTSLKSLFKYAYGSTTTLGAGTFTTTFGWDASTITGGLAALENNLVNGFIPSSGNGGYNDDIESSLRLVSFGGTATGTWVNAGTPSNPIPVLTYTGGTVDMYVLTRATTADAWTTLNFMDVKVTGGFMGPGNTYLTGKVDFTGATTGVANAPFNNLFDAATAPACSSGTGFKQIVDGCGTEAPIFATFNFNTNFPPVVVGNTIAGLHSGDISFDVPEPASLALLGAGLFGLGAARRRKTAA